MIRGGFGVYFNKTEEEIGLQQLSAAPFSLASFGSASVGGSPAFANPYLDVAGGPGATNPFPFVPPTKGQAVDFSQFLPLDINVVNPNFTNPYAMNFNLNIQRELPGATIVAGRLRRRARPALDHGLRRKSDLARRGRGLRGRSGLHRRPGQSSMSTIRVMPRTPRAMCSPRWVRKAAPEYQITIRCRLNSGNSLLMA